MLDLKLEMNAADPLACTDTGRRHGRGPVVDNPSPLWATKALADVLLSSSQRLLVEP